MTLDDITLAATTAQDVAEELLLNDIHPSPDELLTALQKHHAHSFDNYREEWSLAHANEVLELVEMLRRLRT